jgi:Tfp pilus assembly protein PilX
MSRDTHKPSPIASESGFTMIIALGVMFVTSLLLVAAFTALNGDIQLSSTDTAQKQAYYAALAGVQNYEYQLENNPDYWQTCSGPEHTVPEAATASFTVKVLPANGNAACLSTNPFATVIESTGALANSFRIESTGTVRKAKKTLIATFKVTGFLNYVYFTQYEDRDPSLYNTNGANCEKYYEENGVQRSSNCEVITFAKEDSVNGPMHTDDAARVTCSPEVTFGRENLNDAVEINGGIYPSCGASGPTFYTASKTFSKGATLTAPESDTSLAAYVKPEDEFAGLTKLELKGATNQIKVNDSAGEETIPWPANGLIYVHGNGACSYKYNQENADTTTTATEEKPCGDVFVHGSYSKSLTIGAEKNLIIDGSLTQYGTTAGNPPSGTSTLGLIATEFVRVYHPCSNGNNSSGYFTNPWIYAAILSTSHSFLVDNFSCGNEMGFLNIFGAIGQKFRGVVAQGNGSGSVIHGYKKNYEYDERLATDEPPYFLAPLKAGWKVVRETAPTAG